MKNTVPPSSSLPHDERNDVFWYVMRAYKTEKIVEEKLINYSLLEFFIPKHAVVRTYHGKKTVKEVPVIPSIIFIHGNRNQINAFKEECSLIQYVMIKKDGRLDYLRVPERQMQDFIQVSQTSQARYLLPGEVDLSAGSRVRIHGGPFDGVEGFLIRQNRRQKSIVVLLEGLLAVETEVTPELVEVIQKID